MSSVWDVVLSLVPYHLLSYGALLGTELYQSFVMTKICFHALPMPQFTTLQKRVFPAYFKIQVGLVALTVVTHPPMSVVSLLDWWGDYMPLTVAFGTSALNMLVYGPKTQEVMIERIHQETRDGKKYNELEYMSEDMKRINKKFSHNHAMAIHLNAISMIATVWYGFSLASRIKVA